MDLTAWAKASRWLDLTTFGPRQKEVEALLETDSASWLENQFSLPASSHLLQSEKQFSAQGYGKKISRSTRIRAWLDIAFYGEDQLRQRVAYALSQIFVASDQDATLGNHAPAMAHYNDLLCRYAFTDFKSLLRAISLSPVMGHYLTMVDNRKEDPSTGQKPDENYAREIMQLFSVGLYQRSTDGSLVYDNAGQPVPCYQEKDIQELARVFTGWTAPDPELIAPMVNNSKFHDQGKKVVMGTVFPANQTAEQELDTLMALLVNHPSTAPNISLALIQKLVTSNPAKDYVARVAGVFQNNGRGQAGDLRAVLTAIFEDPAVFGSASPQMSQIREPWLALVYIYRALDAKPGGGSKLVGNDLVYLKTCNQYPLGAPSVFNFYQPDFAPQGNIRDQGLVAPELQIIEWAHIISVHNHINAALRLSLQAVDRPLKDQLYVDISQFKQDIVNKDIKGFIERTSLHFFDGTMPDALKGILHQHYNGLEIAPGKWVQRLLFLALSSPWFHVKENRT